MAINLNNVNISLRQFQEISSGKYNPGRRRRRPYASERGMTV